MQILYQIHSIQSFTSTIHHPDSHLSTKHLKHTNHANKLYILYESESRKITVICNENKR